MSVSRAFAKEVNKDIEHLGLKVDTVETVCRAFLTYIINAVKKGENVTFKNTMTFKRVLRNDRTHNNPKTKEKIFKARHYAMVMDVKHALKGEFESIEVAAGAIPDVEGEVVVEA